MELTTPSLLFPAISLLLLAYNNRFQALGLLIRQMTKEGAASQRPRYQKQLEILRRRIGYIKQMQMLGIISFIFCTFSIFSLFIGQQLMGIYLFGFSLITLVASLLFALAETLSSTAALSIELDACAAEPTTAAEW